MSLEFGGRGSLETLERSRDLERLEKLREQQELEDIRRTSELIRKISKHLNEEQSRMLEENGASIEFINQFNRLSSQIEKSQADELITSGFEKRPTFNALEELQIRCREASSIGEINAVRADYEALIQPVKDNRYAAALNQTGINARAGLIKEGIAADVQKVTDTAIKPSAVETAKKTAEQHQKEITAEALRRTQAEQTAAETAAKAQKYYSSLSDVTTGKSAKQSAEVIEASLKAAEEQQRKTAATALSGGGDDVLKTAADKVSETVKTQGDDAVRAKNVKNPKNITGKFSTFIKEKAIPFTKTKQFKYIAAGAAIVTATAAFVGISRHNKNKDTKTKETKTIDIVR